MALTKDKKKEVVAEVSALLKDSKMTVVAKYSGTPVKNLQELRKTAKANGTDVRVVKNRLFKKALSENDGLNTVDTSRLVGQLLYAFNSEDEVAPAQNLHRFAKENPQLEFVAAINSEGNLLEPAEVKALAELPTKEQLRAQLVGTIGAPISSFVGVLNANVRGVLNVLTARAEKIS